jgi:hypothetical protein
MLVLDYWVSSRLFLKCFRPINPYQARWYKNGSLPADSPGFTHLPRLVLAHEACIFGLGPRSLRDCYQEILTREIGDGGEREGDGMNDGDENYHLEKNRCIICFIRKDGTKTNNVKR